jgi:hypothetical protein
MWRPETIGEVIAQRRFSFPRRGKDLVAVLTIGKPVKGPDERDPWWCPVQVGPPLAVFSAIAGEYSLQALVLALGYLQTSLPSLAHAKGIRLEWLGEFERLVFAETDSLVRAWVTLENLTNGVSLAIDQLEKNPGKSKKLLNDLRLLVRSGGAVPVLKRGKSIKLRIWKGRHRTPK